MVAMPGKRGRAVRLRNSGEENLDLLESLLKWRSGWCSPATNIIGRLHGRHHGRLTGKTGSAQSTLGPGATNLVTAGAYAYLGGMPMLMITGQKPIKKSKQGRFQISMWSA